MEALKQIAPKPQTSHYNLQSKDSTLLFTGAIEKAASSLTVELIVVEIHDDDEIERAQAA